MFTLGEEDYQWHHIDVNPEPWAIGPVGVARTGGKLRPYVGRNAQLAEFQAAVKEDLGDVEMLEGKFELRFFFWRERAEYETPQARTHRKHEADVTNLQKATEDALQGVLFKNDKDVIDIHSTLVDQGPDIRGHILVGIKIADKPKLPPSAVNELYNRLSKEVNASSNIWPPTEDGVVF